MGGARGDAPQESDGFVSKPRRVGGSPRVIWILLYIVFLPQLLLLHGTSWSVSAGGGCRGQSSGVTHSPHCYACIPVEDPREGALFSRIRHY